MTPSTPTPALEFFRRIFAHLFNYDLVKTNTMQKRRGKKLDFEVDKLTNSIEDAHTREKIETRVVRLVAGDLNRLGTVKWDFDWRLELEYRKREVY